MPVISIAGKDASALDVAVEVSDGNAVQEPPKARGSRMKRLTRSIQLGDMPTVGRRRNSLTPSSGLTVVTEASPKSGDRATKRRSSTGSVGSNHSDEASATGSEHVSRTPLYQLLGYKSMDDAPPALRRFAGLDAALEKLSASAAETNSPTGTRSTADSAGLTYLDLQSFKEEGSSWSAAFDRVLGRVAGTMRRPRSRKGSKTAYTPDTSGASGSGPTPEERAALARKLLPRLHAAFHNQHDIGGFTGAQAAVRFGRSRVDETGTDWSAGLDPLPAIDLCIGTVRGNERMTRDHIVNWMSTTKPLAAIAIAQLEERGLCDVELPVATYLPKFGQMGKGGVLIKHLLTHTAGVPYADIECWATLHKWDLIVRTICEAPLADDWVPGRRCGYHTYSAWFILGEIVKVLSGLPYEQYVQQHIFAPLGLRDCHVGMSDATFHAYEKQGRLCELRTYAKRKDNKLVENARCPNGITLNEATACVPGANGRGPANEWVAVYEMLLNGGYVLSATFSNAIPSRPRRLASVSTSSTGWAGTG